MSRRKSTAKAKLKATSQQERIQLWKQDFQNLLGNRPEVTHKPIIRNISKQSDIKRGQLIQEELDSVLRKNRNRKAAGLDEVPPEVWKTKKFDNILLWPFNAVYNQNTIDGWTRGCILPFPNDRRLRISQELPRYNPYIHSGQDLQCSTTQLHRTQNWEVTQEEPKWLSEK